ncbi:hypothetical protein PR048_004300 [Dryococelus australis]|uniref:Uncharacterized protein n=1 Tax=Dryococelus australis TaxID=614101 RepID=A0ABQ9I516_9NEOP|nr:hypothetical protein PR048_004300 [Dryococelus australis]
MMKQDLWRQDRLYSLMEYTSLIASSSKQVYFAVKLEDSTDIIDFKQGWPKNYKKSCLSMESFGRAAPRGQNKSSSPQLLHILCTKLDHPEVVECEFKDTFKLSAANNMRLSRKLGAEAKACCYMQINVLHTRRELWILQ